MRRNLCARISDYDIAGLVNVAFTKAAILEIARNVEQERVLIELVI